MYWRTGASQGPALVRKSYWSVLPSGHSNVNYCMWIKRSLVFSCVYEDNRRSLINYGFVTVIPIIFYITPNVYVYWNYDLKNSIKMKWSMPLFYVIYCSYWPLCIIRGKRTDVLIYHTLILPNFESWGKPQEDICGSVVHACLIIVYELDEFLCMFCIRKLLLLLTL